MMNTEALIEAVEHYREYYVNDISPAHVRLLSELLELARDIADTLDWAVQNDKDITANLPGEHPDPPADSTPAAEHDTTSTPPPAGDAAEWEAGNTLDELEHLFFDFDLSNKDMSMLVSYRNRLHRVVQVIDTTIEEVGYYI
jgi:hypothetical protein